MSLNDLLSILTSPNGSLAQADTALAGRVIDGVVKALDDANGEVQNLAVKWYVIYHVLEPYIRALFLAQRFICSFTPSVMGYTYILQGLHGSSIVFSKLTQVVSL